MFALKDFTVKLEFHNVNIVVQNVRLVNIMRLTVQAALLIIYGDRIYRKACIPVPALLDIMKILRILKNNAYLAVYNAAHVKKRMILA